MCDYTQREYSCGHFRWIASKWCRDYTITHKRCQPNVTHFEYRAEELCGTFCARSQVISREPETNILPPGECKPKEYPPWENLIKRPKQPTY
jgi:hypothetical protein